jgi:hypothetical protein
MHLGVTDILGQQPMIIDTDVPLPDEAKDLFRSKGTRGSIYPFHDMEVGQSVFYPMNGAAAIDRHPAYMAAATIQKRYPDYRFTGRTVTENDIRGIRIWRAPTQAAAVKPLVLPTLAQVSATTK